MQSLSLSAAPRVRSLAVDVYTILGDVVGIVGMCVHLTLLLLVVGFVLPPMTVARVVATYRVRRARVALNKFRRVLLVARPGAFDESGRVRVEALKNFTTPGRRCVRIY